MYNNINNEDNEVIRDVVKIQFYRQLWQNTANPDSFTNIHLSIRINEIPNSFTNFVNLEKLTLKFGIFSKITNLSKCVNLKELNLSNGAIRNIDELRCNTNLTSLNLSHNPITSISPLGKLKKLEKLEMVGCRVRNLYETIRKLKNLSSLRQLNFQMESKKIKSPELILNLNLPILHKLTSDLSVITDMKLNYYGKPLSPPLRSLSSSSSLPPSSSPSHFSAFYSLSTNSTSIPFSKPSSDNTNNNTNTTNNTNNNTVNNNHNNNSNNNHSDSMRVISKEEWEYIIFTKEEENQYKEVDDIIQSVIDFAEFFELYTLKKVFQRLIPTIPKNIIKFLVILRKQIDQLLSSNTLSISDQKQSQSQSSSSSPPGQGKITSSSSSSSSTTSTTFSTSISSSVSFKRNELQSSRNLLVFVIHHILKQTLPPPPPPSSSQSPLPSLSLRSSWKSRRKQQQQQQQQHHNKLSLPLSFSKDISPSLSDQMMLLPSLDNMSEEEESTDESPALSPTSSTVQVKLEEEGGGGGGRGRSTLSILSQLVNLPHLLPSDGGDGDGDDDGVERISHRDSEEILMMMNESGLDDSIDTLNLNSSLQADDESNLDYDLPPTDPLPPPPLLYDHLLPPPSPLSSHSFHHISNNNNNNNNTSNTNSSSFHHFGGGGGGGDGGDSDDDNDSENDDDDDDDELGGDDDGDHIDDGYIDEDNEDEYDDDDDMDENMDYMTYNNNEEEYDDEEEGGEFNNDVPIANPICGEYKYRELFLLHLPFLLTLDKESISSKTREEAKEIIKAYFDLPSPTAPLLRLADREMRGGKERECREEMIKMNITKRAKFTNLTSTFYFPRQFEYHPMVPNQMLIGSGNGELMIVNTITSKPISRFYSGIESFILALSWFNYHPTKFIAAADSGEIKLYDYHSINQSGRSYHLTDLSSNPPRSSSFRPRPSPSLKPIEEYSFDKQSKISSAYINCDDKYCLTSGKRVVSLYDIQSGTLMKSFNNMHEKDINVLKFAHNSPNLFATSSFGKEIKMWDLRDTSRPIFTRKSTGCTVMVCFSPDDRYLLSSSSDNEVRQYLTHDGQLHLKYNLPRKGKEINYTRSYYMNGGSHIVTGSCDDHFIRVLNSSTGKMLNEIDLSEVAPPETYCQSIRGDPFNSNSFCALASCYAPYHFRSFQVNFLGGENENYSSFL